VWAGTNPTPSLAKLSARKYWSGLLTQSGNILEWLSCSITNPCHAALSSSAFWRNSL
jgi:hypothetical protein